MDTTKNNVPETLTPKAPVHIGNLEPNNPKPQIPTAAQLAKQQKPSNAPKEPKTSTLQNATRKFKVLTNIFYKGSNRLEGEILELDKTEYTKIQKYVELIT